MQLFTYLNIQVAAHESSDRDPSFLLAFFLREHTSSHMPHPHALTSGMARGGGDRRPPELASRNITPSDDSFCDLVKQQQQN